MLIFNAYWVSFQEIKWHGRDFDQFRPLVTRFRTNEVVLYSSHMKSWCEQDQFHTYPPSK